MACVLQTNSPLNELHVTRLTTRAAGVSSLQTDEVLASLSTMAAFNGKTFIIEAGNDPDTVLRMNQMLSELGAVRQSDEHNQRRSGSGMRPG